MTTATLKWDTALRFITPLHFKGQNAKGHETTFDTSIRGGGLDTAASPMEVVLEASAACTAMDVIKILSKRRKHVTSFEIDLEAERSSDPPQVFTAIRMNFRITSPDVTWSDLSHAIELSWSKYCSVSIMLIRGGCSMSWSADIAGAAAAERIASPISRPSLAVAA
jgi:putative redox protein